MLPQCSPLSRHQTWVSATLCSPFWTWWLTAAGGGGGTCVSEACDPRQAFLLSTDHTHFSFLPLSLDSCPRHSLLKPPVPRPLGELEDREPGRRDGGEV